MDSILRQCYQTLGTFIDKAIPNKCVLCRQQSSNNLCRFCAPLLPWHFIQCEICGSPLYTPGICGGCQQSPPSFQQTIVPFEYRDPIATFVQHLKYQDQLALAQPFGQLIAEHAMKHCNQLPDAIFPMPLHPIRLRHRGYNQSSQIAKFSGKALNIPVNEEILSRIRDTASQTELSRDQRRKNVANAFEVKGLERYDVVAVIDDVITSGASMNAACTALKTAGFQHIQAWALAKT